MYVQCAMQVEDMQRLERMEKMMIRWMCGVRLKDRKGGEKLRQRLGIINVCDRVRYGRLMWFGHVECKDRDDWVSEGGRGKGRKTWKECIVNGMRKMELRREDAQDCNVWRRGILGNCPTCASAETRMLKE